MFKTRMIKLGRTLREGFRNFYRDGWLSFATVSVLTMSLYIIAVTFLVVTIGKTILTDVQNRVSISAYFYPDTSESDILEIKKELEKIIEIDTVTHVPREEAFSNFKETTNDPILKKALEEFDKEGENPLHTALVIKATKPEYYKGISKLLTSENYKEKITDVNYDKNQSLITQLTQIISVAKTVGTSLSGIFISIAILVVYNTVRITMFARRKEFEIMRLVGASNLYARMPSLYEGVFYGTLASIVTLILLTITMYFLTPVAQPFMIGDSTLFHFYLQYFWQILIMTASIGLILGSISGMIAIRRYLHI